MFIRLCTEKQTPVYLYVELWKARAAWLNLPTEQSREYFKKVGSAIEALTEEGVEVVGFAKNDEETPTVVSTASWQFRF